MFVVAIMFNTELVLLRNVCVVQGMLLYICCVQEQKKNLVIVHISVKIVVKHFLPCAIRETYIKIMM